jgi:hypothetical protein
MQKFELWKKVRLKKGGKKNLIGKIFLLRVLKIRVAEIPVMEETQHGKDGSFFPVT